MMSLARLPALFFLIALTEPLLAAEPVIGSVVRTEGQCTGTGEGTAETLAPGMAVRLNETMTTGTDARLELVFDDGTRLTVGERATVMLDRFVYQPGGANVLHAAVTGPFRFVTGTMVSGASRQASVTTPYALIGVRGTDFWGGPIDGAFGVFLTEGTVAVAAGGREVVLSAPGASVDIGGGGAAPGDATVWPADKVARAIATVTFR